MTNRFFFFATQGKCITFIASPFLSDAFLHVSNTVLFRDFHAKQVRFQQNCVLPLLPLGMTSGFVIDVDYKTTTMYAVGFGVVDLFHSISNGYMMLFSSSTSTGCANDGEYCQHVGGRAPLSLFALHRHVARFPSRLPV